MIHDLEGAGARAVEAEVLVIGAGTVGLALAARLAREGLKVVCLESGGPHQAGDEHPLNEVEHARARYAGAAHGRFRCLGGSSTRWGGALIPFQAADLAGAGWPLAHEEMLAWLPEVEALFGLAAGPYDLAQALPAGDHLARLAKWPRFARRNVARLLDAELRAPDGPAVWLHATATDFALDGDRLRGVTARAPDGSTLRVGARQCVIAAGAIESTRLLLLADRQHGGRIDGGHGLLGRYFHDHLSVVVAALEPVDRRALNRLLGFRFERGGAMRNLRFELAADTPLRARLPASFAHVGFESAPGGGFDALRELLRHLQQRRPPPPATLARLLRAAPWLARAAWWRFVHRRLLYPADARLQLHMVIEQRPKPENRIGLSERRVDAYGQPLARIDWAPDAEDQASLTRSVDAIEATWATSGLGRLARLVRRPPGEAERELAAGGGIYHPGGSTRMGATPREGVVDPELRLFALPNVSVLATSVLPTGGGANPTMMLMLLGMRCAARLVQALRPESPAPQAEGPGPAAAPAAAGAH